MRQKDLFVRQCKCISRSYYDMVDGSLSLYPLFKLLVFLYIFYVT